MAGRRGRAMTLETAAERRHRLGNKPSHQPPPVPPETVRYSAPEAGSADPARAAATPATPAPVTAPASVCASSAACAVDSVGTSTAVDSVPEVQSTSSTQPDAAAAASSVPPASNPQAAQEELAYLARFRKRAHTQVLIRQGKVAHEEPDAMEQLSDSHRLLLLNAVKSDCISMEEMTSIGDEMRECIRSNDHAGLNDIITSLQTQVAESDPAPRRPQTLVRIPSKAAAGIDRLDNDQRMAVMRVVAEGSLPESEALRLMEAYLQIEQGRRSDAASEDADGSRRSAASADGEGEGGSIGREDGTGIHNGDEEAQQATVHGVEVVEGEGLTLESSDDTSPHSRRTSRGLRLPFLSGRRRSVGSGDKGDGHSSSGHKASVGKGIDGRFYQSPADAFYEAVSTLDDMQRMAVLEAVRNGNFTQDEALALVKSFLAGTTFASSEFCHEAPGLQARGSNAAGATALEGATTDSAREHTTGTDAARHGDRHGDSAEGSCTSEPAARARTKGELGGENGEQVDAAPLRQPPAIVASSAGDSAPGQSAPQAAHLHPQITNDHDKADGRPAPQPSSRLQLPGSNEKSPLPRRASAPVWPTTPPRPSAQQESDASAGAATGSGSPTTAPKAQTAAFANFDSPVVQEALGSPSTRRKSHLDRTNPFAALL